MDQPYNPLAGTSLHDLWYLRRKAPGGRVVHLIDPVYLGALCGALNCRWQYPPEAKKYGVCAKCRGAAYQASLSEEIDNEHFK